MSYSIFLIRRANILTAPLRSVLKNEKCKKLNDLNDFNNFNNLNDLNDLNDFKFT